jgi:hypothetical protein
MNLYKVSILAIMLVFSGITSCDVDNHPVIPDNPSTPDIVKEGAWKITLFDDSGENETYHFTDYLFTFDSTGTVTAIKDSSAIDGTWRAIKDDNQDELIFDFGSCVPFNDLNDDWDIIEKTDVKIHLVDVSGGNEPNDYLTFERN